MPVNRHLWLMVLFCCIATSAFGQEDNNQKPVTITVNLKETVGKMNPVWAYFGYDESNYTYMKNGKKLLSELAELSPVAVNIRAHYLLATGNGIPRPKWSSTNAYTENAGGQPIYNWHIIDSIFDTYVKRGLHPFVEIGFMPKALSTHPEPYEPDWSPKPPHGEEMTGYTYPPKDYKKWAELIYQWTKHCLQRYGKKEVASWYWEVWNEPDISYWHGTEAEYFKLYDYSVAAVRRAFPAAVVGGPATTSPRSAHAAKFLQDFLVHCENGDNYVSGEKGAPLDFISFHAKGSPKVVDGHIQMGIKQQMQDVTEGFKVVASSNKFHNLPVIISEADPEGCAGCSSKYYPNNTYRNGTMYSSYTAASFSRMYALADSFHVNLQGALSWSFEFENQPFFAGFRSLATNGIDKPVLNVFRMFGMMSGDRVAVQSDSAIDFGRVLNDGIHNGKADINALASTAGNSAWIMLWNYADDALPAPAADIKLSVKGISASKILIRRYRVDEDHSNAYTLWKKMGSPQRIDSTAYKKLEKAGQLQLLTSPQWLSVNNDMADINCMLPRRAVALIHISW